MGLGQVEVYRDDLFEYLRARGYDAKIADEWVKKVYKDGGRAVPLSTIFDILLFPWENQETAEYTTTDEITEEQKAENARLSLVKHLEGKCLLLGSRVVPSRDGFAIAIQIANFSTPGFQLPKEWEGFFIKVFQKAI